MYTAHPYPSSWTPRPPPTATSLDGRYVCLERLDYDLHRDGLYALNTLPDAEQRMTFVRGPLPRRAFDAWLRAATTGTWQDEIYYALREKAGDEVNGRQRLVPIDQSNGVMEIAGVLWGPLIARRPAATEAVYLHARYVFDELGYRRLQWRCNNLNEASKRAATRFGFTFEGIARRHVALDGGRCWREGEGVFRE
jgi:RimJ/RimL family protein N-acetyltransferase